MAGTASSRRGVMVPLVVFFGAMVALLAFGREVKREPNFDVRASLKPTRTEFAVGEPVVVECYILNTGQKGFWLLDRAFLDWLPWAPCEGASFKVSHEGVDQPYRGMFIQFVNPEGITVSATWCGPNSFRRSLADLSAHYDLSAPGEYTVRFLDSVALVQSRYRPRTLGDFDTRLVESDPVRFRMTLPTGAATRGTGNP